jgi:AcrR family transcriptional regulator
MSDKKLKEFNVFGIKQTLPMRPENSQTKDTILLESTLLFAKKGYEAVSIRDIANSIKMKPSSLYNHFQGKEALFETVLNHAEDLYLLYFKYLDDSLSKARTFSEILDCMFVEPTKMSNDFTCYAFSLILTEQFRDAHCARIFNETFLDYSINFIKTWFDRCVEKGLAFRFDTRMAATLYMHTILICINLRVQEYMEHRPPINFRDHFHDFKRLIMSLAGFSDMDAPLPDRLPPTMGPFSDEIAQAEANALTEDGMGDDSLSDDSLADGSLDGDGLSEDSDDYSPESRDSGDEDDS